MRDKSPSEGAKNQAIDLSSCAFAPLPSTGIRLLLPDRKTSKRLETQLDIPARLTFVRKLALQGIGNQEVFAQKSFTVGRTEGGLLVVVIISLLTTKKAWRGGWVVFLVQPTEKEAFERFLHVARNGVVRDLRQERASGGSVS